MSTDIKFFNKLISVLNSYAGRDKIAKTMHYTARIAVWYFASVK